MGFDGIASQAIMFIAVVGASAMLVLAFNSQITQTSDSMTEQQDALQSQIKTAVNIETAYYNSTSQIVTFYARNTGSTTLRIDKLGIYVGTFRVGNATTQRNVSVLADTTTGTSSNVNYWDPDEVIMGNLSTIANGGVTTGTTNTLRLVTQYISEDTYDFVPI